MYTSYNRFAGSFKRTCLPRFHKAD